MKEKVAIALVAIWILAFVWILFASAPLNCAQSGPIWEAQGLCLWRRIASISCILGFELAIGVAAGFQAQAKRYPFIIGFLLGFFLSIMGALFVLMWSPRQPGQPIGRNVALFLLGIVGFILLVLIIGQINLAIQAR